MAGDVLLGAAMFSLGRRCEACGLPLCFCLCAFSNLLCRRGREWNPRRLSSRQFMRTVLFISYRFLENHYATYTAIPQQGVLAAFLIHPPYHSSLAKFQLSVHLYLGPLIQNDEIKKVSWSRLGVTKSAGLYRPSGRVLYPRLLNLAFYCNGPIEQNNHLVRSLQEQVHCASEISLACSLGQIL